MIHIILIVNDYFFGMSICLNWCVTLNVRPSTDSISQRHDMSYSPED